MCLPFAIALALFRHHDFRDALGASGQSLSVRPETLRVI